MPDVHVQQTQKNGMHSHKQIGLCSVTKSYIVQLKCTFVHYAKHTANIGKQKILCLRNFVSGV